MLDVTTNVLLLAVDVVWLMAALRRPDRVLGLVLLAGAVAGILVGALALGVGGGGFGVMRAFAWLIFAHGPLVLLAGSLITAGRDWAATGLQILSALAVGAAGLDAFFVEPTALEVNRFEIPTRELDQPVRIVVLADIQADDIGEYERSVFARAAALEPDLVLLPGDFVQTGIDEYPEQVARFRDLLTVLRPPLGVWAVEGNSERRFWAEDLFAHTGVRAGEGTVTSAVGPLTLTALSFRDGFDTELRLEPVDGFHVVFAHAPDFSLSADVGGDLLIAGHTHGGQVQLPLIGPLITFSHVSRRAAAGGVTDLGGGRQLLVSRGIGMERGSAPRLRFLCPPEIVVVDLVPDHRPGTARTAASSDGAR